LHIENVNNRLDSTFHLFRQFVTEISNKCEINKFQNINPNKNIQQDLVRLQNMCNVAQ